MYEFHIRTLIQQQDVIPMLCSQLLYDPDAQFEVVDSDDHEGGFSLSLIVPCDQNSPLDTTQFYLHTITHMKPQTMINLVISHFKAIRHFRSESTLCRVEKKSKDDNNPLLDYTYLSLEEQYLIINKQCDIGFVISSMSSVFMHLNGTLMPFERGDHFNLKMFPSKNPKYCLVMLSWPAGENNRNKIGLMTFQPKINRLLHALGHNSDQ